MNPASLGLAAFNLASHVMSRTALDGFPLQDIEKDHLMAPIAKLSRINFVDLLGFCLMGNHFYLAILMQPSKFVTNEEITRRYKLHYGQDATIILCQVDEFRYRLANLGAFIKEIKQGFSKYYNKRKKLRGTF